MNADVIQIIQAGPYWDWRVALDLFLGGAGVGSFLMAVLIDERFNGRYRRICTTAAWLSPLLIGAGLILIMMKLGRPLMLFLSFTTINLTSPLWWGGVFQPILLIGAIIYAMRWKNFSEDDTKRGLIGRLLVPVALIVGVYHGMLLSVMVARPLWNAGPTVVAALLGFASTGIAVVMLVHLIRMKMGGRLQDTEHVRTFLDNMTPIRNTLFAVLLIQLGTFILWWLSLTLGTFQDQAAMAAASEEYGALFWWLGIGVGIILPVLLGAYSVLKGERTNMQLRVSIITITSIMILVGGFVFRLCQTLGGQIEIVSNITF